MIKNKWRNILIHEKYVKKYRGILMSGSGGKKSIYEGKKVTIIGTMSKSRSQIKQELKDNIRTVYIISNLEFS